MGHEGVRSMGNHEGLEVTHNRFVLDVQVSQNLIYMPESNQLDEISANAGTE